MKRITVAILAISCSQGDLSHDPDFACAGGSPDDKGADPLSFGRYGGSYGRDPGELLDGLACAATRWRQATCLDVDLSLSPEGWARWLEPSQMPPGAQGFVSGPFNNTRIKIISTLHSAALCPALVHELGHVLRRDYGHSDEDGSMSFPIMHVFSEPVSRITQTDIDAVCDTLNCGCQNPE